MSSMGDNRYQLEERSRGSLQHRISRICELAYPEHWEPEWLLLPLDHGGFLDLQFQVVCSEIVSAYEAKKRWPPAVEEPKLWICWESGRGTRLWIRPRQYDPVMRNRLVLLPTTPAGPRENVDGKVTAADIVDMYSFAAESGHVVWYNPARGGAGLPRSVHFQSMPLFKENSNGTKYALPCCGFTSVSPHDHWTKTDSICCYVVTSGHASRSYPVLGFIVWGNISEVASLTWRVISEYDCSACNIIVQPDGDSGRVDVVRAFVFPRSRKASRTTVRQELLNESEMILLQNNRFGSRHEWGYAALEMGLLTQIVWGPLFEIIRQDPMGWSKVFLRLLLELTLNKDDGDWHSFREVAMRLSSEARCILHSGDI